MSAPSVTYVSVVLFVFLLKDEGKLITYVGYGAGEPQKNPREESENFAIRGREPKAQACWRRTRFVRSGGGTAVAVAFHPKSPSRFGFRLSQSLPGCRGIEPKVIS